MIIVGVSQGLETTSRKGLIFSLALVICNPEEPGKGPSWTQRVSGERTEPSHQTQGQGHPLHSDSDRSTPLDALVAGNTADQTALSEPCLSRVHLCSGEQQLFEGPALGKNGDARPKVICPFSHIPFHAQPEREHRLILSTAFWQTGASEQKFPVLV